MRRTTRREFVKAGVAGACGLGIGGGALVEGLIAGENGAATSGMASAGAAAMAPVTGKLPIKKGLVWDMLPGGLSYAERFKMARDAGFEVVQAPTRRRTSTRRKRSRRRRRGRGFELIR